MRVTTIPIRAHKRSPGHATAISRNNALPRQVILHGKRRVSATPVKQEVNIPTDRMQNQSSNTATTTRINKMATTDCNISNEGEQHNTTRLGPIPRHRTAMYRNNTSSSHQQSTMYRDRGHHRHAKNASRYEYHIVDQIQMSANEGK